MSDASTSLDEDMDNNIDEEEDNMDNDNDRGDSMSMNTSSDEVGSLKGMIQLRTADTRHD